MTLEDAKTLGHLSSLGRRRYKKLRWRSSVPESGSAKRNMPDFVTLKPDTTTTAEWNEKDWSVRMCVCSVCLPHTSKRREEKERLVWSMSFYNDLIEVGKSDILFFLLLWSMFTHDCLNSRMELIVCQQQGVNLIAIGRMRVDNFFL